MLQAQVRRLGGELNEEGTFPAPSHRVFALLCKAVSSDDKAVVDDVERGEEYIKVKFEDALQDDAISVASAKSFSLAMLLFFQDATKCVRSSMPYTNKEH